MNPFSPDDRVQCKEKNRRNGTVLCIMCGFCEKCKTKPVDYKLCTAEDKDKNKVYVSYPDSNKRFKYDFAELEVEPPLPIKPPQKVYDLSAKDIRPLGDAQISVPLIVSDDDDDAGEDGTPDQINQTNIESGHNIPNGTFFDAFLSLQTMEYPI